MLLGLVAAAAEPISGGRHKVIGHADLHIIPQTSTIASHLPRAVGLAFALGRAARLGAASRWPADAIVVASLGDASVNHSTAVGALNTAGYCAYQRLPLPLLVVCEDNGLGISVRTPPGWVEAATSGRPGFTYFHADGSDLADVYDTTLAAAALARHRRSPVFLHLSMVRLGGHAGADAETGYRDRDDVAADLAADPLIGTARLLVEAGLLTPAEVLDRYERSRARVLERAQEVAGAPRLATAEQVMAPLAPRNPEAVWADAILAAADEDKRHAAFGGRLPETGRAAHPGPDHQRHAHRRDGGAAGDAGVRRGCRPQGRGVRGDPRAAVPVRRRPGLRHPARRAGHPRPGAGRRAGRAAARAGDPVPRLPAQRRRPDPRRGAPPCPSSPRASTATRWWCGSPATPTRKASAGTSTTTTRWRRCGTSRA